MTAVDRLAATLAKHPLYADEQGDECKCGWKPDYGELDLSVDAPIPAYEQVNMQHAAHVAAEITFDDLAVIELPDGQPAIDPYGKPITDYLHQGRTVMYIDPAEPPVYVGKPYVGPYDVQMMRGASGQRWTPDGAVEFAGALIATARAAKAAEGASRDGE